VDRDGRDLELAAEGAPIEGFDVLQLVDETQITGLDEIAGQRPEHERIVTVRRMCDAQRDRHGSSSGEREESADVRGVTATRQTVRARHLRVGNPPF
jgi:hypothetical protein